MKKSTQHRREFLQHSAAAAAALAVPYWFSEQTRADDKPGAKNDRFRLGVIGCGSRAGGIVPNAKRYADVLAVCDVDKTHAERGREQFSEGKADLYEDYRKVLDRNDIDVVAIVTPDHWHAKIAIEAMQAGKDVYCERPLTLTIDEGKQVCKVQKETGRVVQVGTQQRSESGKRFLTAVAMIKDGRIGKVKRVQCAIGGSDESGPLSKEAPPPSLNWDMWLGQAPQVDYIPRRCHYEFRWWYEYSGGKMTDWGSHHVDIAQWAIGMDHSGPSSLEVLMAQHPVPLKAGVPTVDNQYNTATKFNVKCMFPEEIELIIRHDTDNGILFEGTDGSFFVSRSKIEGKPVDNLVKNPLPEGALKKLYKGKKPGNHIGNFFECVQSREQPISDVETHHRTLTTCHLANIAIRLNRKLVWDPEQQQIVGDDEANGWLKRQQRKGYEAPA